MSEPTFHIEPIDAIGKTISGVDTTILSMPPEFYVQVFDEEPALAVKPFGKFLNQLAHKQAGDLGERLHHAEFVITKDPAVVQARGSLHDCDECRAGVRIALRHLKEEPETELIVGTLYWAEP